MIQTLHNQVDLAQQAVLAALEDPAGPDVDGQLSRLEDLIDISRHHGVDAVASWLDPRVRAVIQRDGVRV